MLLVNCLGNYLSQKIGFYAFWARNQKVNEEFLQLCEVIEDESSNFRYLYRSDANAKFNGRWGYDNIWLISGFNFIKKQIFSLPRNYRCSLTKNELSRLYLLDKYGWNYLPKTRRIRRKLYQDEKEKLQKEFEERRRRILEEEEKKESSWWSYFYSFLFDEKS